MGIVSLENTDRLFWLGRYSERAYTTIKLFAASYDTMLDSALSDYVDFCKRLEIPNIYESGADFIHKYCFGEDDPNSIYSNLMRAYDNGIVLREEIGTETLAYIQLAVYAMNMARNSAAPLIELQEVIDNILAFWGIADDLIESENVRNIIKVGKRIERLDLYARLHMPKKQMLWECHRLAGRIPRTDLKYKKDELFALGRLVESDEIDYYMVIKTVENLLEE